MTTDFNKNVIIVGGGLRPSQANMPSDARTRIESINEVESIPNPFIGMIFYVMGEEKFYVVTLRQRYVSDNYSDDGWLFLSWDFTDPNKPLVHVRTWQPHKTPNGLLPKNDVFSVEDFEL